MPVSSGARNQRQNRFTSAPGSTEDAYCDDDNDLLPDCTLDFIAACVAAAGTFNWYDTTEESGECAWVTGCHSTRCPTMSSTIESVCRFRNKSWRDKSTEPLSIFK